MVSTIQNLTRLNLPMFIAPLLVECFESGDSRTSENLGLSGIHSLFIREHNRIAQQLALINSAWNFLFEFEGDLNVAVTS